MDFSSMCFISSKVVSKKKCSNGKIISTDYVEITTPRNIVNVKKLVFKH